MSTKPSCKQALGEPLQKPLHLTISVVDPLLLFILGSGLL